MTTLEKISWIGSGRVARTLRQFKLGRHGGQSGRYDSLRDDAFDYAFMLTQLGIRN